MADRRRLSVRAPPIVSELDVSEAHKRAVERALRWAWREVGQRWPEIVKAGAEEQITAKMVFRPAATLHAPSTLVSRCTRATRCHGHASISRSCICGCACNRHLS